MTRKILFVSFLSLIFSSFYSLASAEIVIKNQAEADQFLSCKRQCNAELYAKQHNYADSPCTNKCEQEILSARGGSSSSATDSTSAVTSVETLQTAEPWNQAANKYHDRYLDKCTSERNNDPSSISCCNEAAVADTNNMQKRGVFDTPTTAEPPIFIDESKCQAPTYKYECLQSFSSPEKKDNCKVYLNHCMEVGKYITSTQDARKKQCEADYVLNRALQLNDQEKYISYCTKSDQFKIAGEDSESRINRCYRGYTSGFKNYIDHCIVALNKANYTSFSSWFIKIRGLFQPALYRPQTLQCQTRFSQAVDKMTGL